jgi:hypothetical protein
MNEDLMNLLSGAGLGDLIGSSKYSWRVRRVMAKKAPKYERKDALKKPPFRIENMTDGLISKHIQTNYGKPPVKKFDWVKAALRADKLSPTDKKWEEVHKPEYWGLYWAEDKDDTNPAALKPVSNGGKGENWVNSDGIQFPPVKYDGYYGLRHIGNADIGETIRTARGKEGVERERVRSDMLYFRADDMPDFEELPEFGKNINRARGKLETVRERVNEDSPFTVNRKIKKPYTGKVYKKEYNGIVLIGTDRVMAKGKTKGNIKPVDEDGKPFDGPTNAEVEETEEAAENEMVEPEKEKPKPKRKINFVKKKKEEEKKSNALKDIKKDDKRLRIYRSFLSRLNTLVRHFWLYNASVLQGKAQYKMYQKDKLTDLMAEEFDYKKADVNAENVIKAATNDDIFEELFDEDDLEAMNQLMNDKQLDEFVELSIRFVRSNTKPELRKEYPALLFDIS